MTFRCQFKSKDRAQERRDFYKSEGLKVHSLAEVIAPNNRDIVWEIEVDHYPITKAADMLGIEEDELQAELELIAMGE